MSVRTNWVEESFALINGASAESQALLEFLRSSPAAAGIFRHYGFTPQAP